MKHRVVEPAICSRFLFPIFLALIALLFPTCPALADSHTFDLVGPRIEMTVNRSGKTLPISSVPNLQAGDRLWIQTDFPANESVRYLLIVAFLEGPTNPPPENWFTRVETWTKKAREEGIVVTVPPNAQQALLFLAPETSGDIVTLRSTVRARPGVFVRASQDLNQASLDRTRVDKYLDEIRETSANDPAQLHARAILLAQSLHLKVDEDCFNKPAEQQPSCLTQNTEDMVLDDGHSQSLVTALTSGPSSDLVGAVSSTPVAGAGYYSAYVGSVIDLARLLDNLHTAMYQYIPALSIPKDDQLNLKLNAPPSFRNPKSVIVVGLPAVEAAKFPPLRPIDSHQIFCLQKSPLVLPVEGAPLVYSTPIAHDVALRVSSQSGKSVDLPATADAARGGFLVDTHSLKPGEFGAELSGTLHGVWGFDTFDGPAFQFRTPQDSNWKISSDDMSALIVGREDTLHITSSCVSCVEQVKVLDAAGKELKAEWKAKDANELDLQIPLKDETAGELKLQVKQFGLAQPEILALHSYAEAAHLDRFTINAGDRAGVLTGTRLDEVGGFDLNGVHFLPAKLTRVNQEDSLNLSAPPSTPDPGWKPDETLQAHVSLKDGRVLDLQTTVEPPRPKVSLVSKSVQPGATSSGIRLGNTDELPQDAHLSFFLKTEVPAKFPREEKIEVATIDGSSDVLLSVAGGNLVLQDSESALAILDPPKNFGPSAFGPLQFRPVAEDGTKGDWQPLANLVRIPSLKDVHCPAAPDKQCTLAGSNLFLLDSVASDAQFKDVVPVPAGYAGSTISVPRPNGTLLYIKLRDDPAVVASVALPVLPLPDNQ